MTDKKPKKPPETDPDQSERFRKAVRDLEVAGELSPTADDAFDLLITAVIDRRGETGATEVGRKTKAPRK